MTTASDEDFCKDGNHLWEGRVCGDWAKPVPTVLQTLYWGAVPMVLYCPAGHQHIDEGERATRPHRTHQCQALVYCVYTCAGGCPPPKACGLEWRPAKFPTVGVADIDAVAEERR